MDANTQSRHHWHMASEYPMPPPLNFTDAAALKVGQLIEQEGNTELKLRVYISGGGCSGFQYGFTFDEAVEDGDTEIENGGVTLLIDPMSVQYLTGAEIDYKERPVRSAIHHSQSQCQHDLRLRIVLLRLNVSTSRARVSRAVDLSPSGETTGRHGGGRPGFQ